MQVDQNLKTDRRVTEASFEDAFGKALFTCGLSNWHMLNREAGWPDRYVVGGIWIEFKVLDCFGKNNEVRKEQKTKMTELSAAGDRVFYCARCGDRVLFEEWHVVKGKNLKQFHNQTFHYRDHRDLEEIIRYKIIGGGHEERCGIEGKFYAPKS